MSKRLVAHRGMLGSAWLFVRDVANEVEPGRGGAGSALNPAVLISAGVATFVATVVSAIGIVLQLKNYRKPLLQRMTIRIMVMVPLYAISSLISLFSLDAAFAIDAIRDIYEAFVIYNFFSLIVAYLGGERSVLILLYGRPPRNHVFPVNLFVRELDASDPFTFLFLKRGILQYVQVKPILTAATLLLKATGTYKEGELSWSAGYLYISFVYNISICVSLYCLAMFWVCVNADIKPFRPMPKFLCVKGILFFSFWQAITVSALVAAGIIKQIGPYTDSEHMSLAITDTLICYEMPFFAFAHWFAFSHTDYIDKQLQYAARMPFYYAFRDAFGLLDVLEDSRATLRGGVTYRTFEPVEGGMHQGIGRDRRIKAGLRYSKGGRQKYWLPMPQENSDTRHTGPVSAAKTLLEERNQARHGYAPVLDEQDEVFRDETRTRGPDQAGGGFLGDGEEDPVDELEYHDPVDDEWSQTLEFDAPDPEMERLYADSRKLLFGDYHYPVIDVSGEDARRRMWEEEERILTDQRAAFGSPTRPMHPSLSLLAGAGAGGRGGGGQSILPQYGATASTSNGISSVLRTQSDPDPHAARSAIERHQTQTQIPSHHQRLNPKGKASAAPGSGRKGVYGGWAEHAAPSSSSTSALPNSNSTNANASGTQQQLDHTPDLPVIDYTHYEPMTPDTDPSAGAIDLRYARTTMRPPAPRVSTTTTAAPRGGLGLGLDIGRGSPSLRHQISAQSSLSRKQQNQAGGSRSHSPLLTASEASVPSSPNGRGVSGVGGSPQISHVRPELRGRHGSSASSTQSTPQQQQQLPPDAIDLVVEDVEAQEDEMTRERRKGEPAVRATGERRIYRREYIMKSPEDERVQDIQVEVEREPGVPGVTGDSSKPLVEERKVTVRDEAGNETHHLETQVDNTAPPPLPSSGELEVADEVPEEEIIREATPPRHTRVLFSPPPDDISNPWS